MRSFLASMAVVTAGALQGCGADSTGPTRLSRTAEKVVKRFEVAIKGGDLVPSSAKVYCKDTFCYAAAFEFTDYHGGADPHTLFTAYFQNLQGTYPPDGPIAPLALDRFVFQFFDENFGPDWVDASGDYRSFSAVGNVLIGTWHAWSNDSPAQGQNSDVFTADGYGIIGCTGPNLWPEFPLEFFAFQTCPSLGFDGWVRVDFKLRHTGLAPKKSPVRFHDFRFSFGTTDSPPGTMCSIGGTEQGSCAEMPYSHVTRR